MIIHRFTPRAGLAVVTPEDEEDLWSLRRIIAKGDFVSSETTRVVKPRGEFTRPDKGERVRVSLTIQAEKISFDSTLARLRVAGKVVYASDESVGKGSFHSLTLTPERKLGIKKERWSDLDSRTLNTKAGEESALVIVAIDRREAGIGRIKGTHLKTYPTVNSGAAGKMYDEKGRQDTSFYKTVAESMVALQRPGDRVFVVGPGNVKNAFMNAVRREFKEVSDSVLVVEGVDVAGEDGVIVALRSPGLKKAVEESKLARVSFLIDEFVQRVSRNDQRVCMGVEESEDAAKMRAIQFLLVSDRVFELAVGEERLIQLLNTVEASGGLTYLVDSSTDLGLRISSFGGVVGLLRFPVKR